MTRVAVATTSLEELVSLFEKQSMEIAALRSQLAVQFTRIAQMQAELDMLPTARARRKILRTRMLHPAPTNGNGHGVT